MIMVGGDRNSVSKDDEDGEDLLTLSQRFHLRSNSSISKKKLKIRLGTKKKGHSWKSVKSLTKPKKLEMGLGTKRKGWKSLTKLVGSERPTRTRRCKQKTEEKRKLNDDFEVETCAAMEQAAEVQKNLDPEFPSFFKLMLRSHVTHGFWLGLPMEFWRLHLPKCDTTIILEGEDGIEYPTKFLSEKVGLSGGWRGFSLVHKLLEGDVFNSVIETLVSSGKRHLDSISREPLFELLSINLFRRYMGGGKYMIDSLSFLSTNIDQKIKELAILVYIVRANRLAEVDGALNLIHLDDSASETHFACNKKIIQTNQSQETPVEKDKMAVNSCLAPVTDESANGMEVITSEDMDNCGISNSFVKFRDFKIIVNDSIINSELSRHLQANYYDLCCTRKSYLHDRLFKGINQTLAAGIVSETMNIADAIRASKLSTSLDDYAAWDKTLEAFEILGMDVGFLRARLNRLLGLAVGSTEEVDSKSFEEASCERDRVKEEMRTLELKLLELKQASSRLEKDMESMKEKAERYEIMFQEEASAAW